MFAELILKNLAVRLRLELRNRLSPIDGLAIRSNTIIGPHHLNLAPQPGLEPGTN